MPSFGNLVYVLCNLSQGCVTPVTFAHFVVKFPNFKIQTKAVEQAHVAYARYCALTDCVLQVRLNLTHNKILTWDCIVSSLCRMTLYVSACANL